jgi:predicted Zn-dependent protease
VILARSGQPLYYLHTMTAQQKSRREVLEALVAEKPDEAFSRYGLALEFVNAGDVVNAEAQFRELLQRNPTYVPGYQMLGQLLVKQSRAEEARAILAQGISAAAKSGNGHAQSEMEGLLAEL